MLVGMGLFFYTYLIEILLNLLRGADPTILYAFIFEEF